MTNGEKLAKLSNEEFIAWLKTTSMCDICIYGNEDKHCAFEACHEGVIGWLKQEIREE